LLQFLESKPLDLAVESKPSDLAVESKPSDLAVESKPSDLDEGLDSKKCYLRVTFVWRLHLMLEIINKIASHPIIVLLGLVGIFVTLWGKGIWDLVQHLKKRKPDKNLPTKQYDVFLSHTKPDIEQSRKLAESLKQVGVKVWFEEWVLKGGDHQASKPREGIQASRQIVAILTPAYFSPKSLDNFTLVVEALSQTSASLAKERPVIPLLFEHCEIPAIF